MSKAQQFAANTDEKVSSSKPNANTVAYDQVVDSLYPYTSPSTEMGSSTVDGNNINASLSFLGIPINYITGVGAPTVFAQTLPSVRQDENISKLSIVATYSGLTILTTAFPQSAVQVSGAGWSHSGSSIVWTKGSYASWSGAAFSLSGNLVPLSGATYYLSMTFNDHIEGSIQKGGVGVLSVPAKLQDTRVGGGLFGTTLNGTPEVTLTSGTRDTLSLPNNQDLSSNTLIPSVGSRFFR